MPATKTELLPDPANGLRHYGDGRESALLVPLFSPSVDRGSTSMRLGVLSPGEAGNAWFVTSPRGNFHPLGSDEKKRNRGVKNFGRITSLRAVDTISSMVCLLHWLFK